MRDEGRKHDRGQNNDRSHSHIGINTTETECIRLYGISEGEKFPDGIRPASVICYESWIKNILCQRILLHNCGKCELGNFHTVHT